MKRDSSPPGLSEQFDGGETAGMETIRSMVETLRTVIDRRLQSEPDRIGMEALGGTSESTISTVLSRVLPDRKTTHPSPIIGVNGGHKTSYLETIRSRLDTATTGTKQILGTETNRSRSGSLEELGGSSSAPISDRLHRIGNEHVSRRTVVQTAGYAATTGAFGAAVQGIDALSQRTNREEDAAVSQSEGAVSHNVDHDQGTAVQHEVDREQHTILGGTQYETTIHTISSPNNGPTAMIFGGVHGNERGGIEAAHLATEYTIDRGTLVVSPETNKAAVEREGNHGPEGDLNRQFPPNEEPTTEVARGVWGEIVRVDPDYLLDAHNATTLMSRGSVGQGVFPTSGVVEEAEEAVAAVNEEYLDERISDDLPEHAFQVGNVVTEDRPRMNHKAAAEQGVEGWSVEVTRIDLMLDERTFLQDMLTRELLHQVGIDVVSDPDMTNPF